MRRPTDMTVQSGSKSAADGIGVASHDLLPAAALLGEGLSFSVASRGGE